MFDDRLHITVGDKWYQFECSMFKDNDNFQFLFIEWMDTGQMVPV